MAVNKLDKDGFIFPLAIGALALIFFAFYFLGLGPKSAAEKPITGAQDLNAAAKDLDAQNPDSFSADLNSNSTDAANF